MQATKMARVDEGRMRALTIRVPEDFHRRLMSKLSGEGMKLQAKVQSMLEEYVDGPAEERAEFTRQIGMAKEVMREYEPALRELAR